MLRLLTSLKTNTPKITTCMLGFLSERECLICTEIILVLNEGSAVEQENFDPINPYSFLRSCSNFLASQHTYNINL